MKTEFPFNFKDEHGHEAIVTNPEQGHYHFEIVNPKGEPAFDWYDQYYQHPKETIVNNTAKFSFAEVSLLITFHQLQR